MEILEKVKRKFTGANVYLIDRMPVCLELSDKEKAALYGKKERSDER